MQVEEYPKFTIILRGYSSAEAEAILQAMVGLEKQFAVEITLNTENALKQLQNFTKKYGQTHLIGAGTVRTLAEAQQAYEAGAKYLLGPHLFTNEMLAFTKEKQLLAIPAAMTPSEVNQMVQNDANIVKIFPAAVVTPRFFKDVQAPLGKLPLMAVGGVNSANAKEFLKQGASYLGLGSNLFNPKDIQEKNIDNLAKTLHEFVAAVE